MQSMGRNLKDFALSSRRVVAMAVAIGCHGFLLAIILRPASDPRDPLAVVVDESSSLELNFILPRPTSARSSAPQTAELAGRRGRPANLWRSSQARHLDADATRADKRPTNAPSSAETTAPSTDPVVSPNHVATDRQGAFSSPSGDGGFRDRLLDAQHSTGVPNIPGSDHRIAHGIQLTDPMNQGVGAVMRDTQRLFGVTNRHCIDVEVWQSLSPDELSARHLTPDDVRSEGEKYNCNRPLGLSF
jgi:hypothetical protein